MISGAFLIFSCTPNPKPTADPNAILTMVAKASSEKMTQTAQAIEMLLTPTETPVPMPVRPTVGSKLTPQTNGTTFFSDATTGIEILIPEKWMALRIGEPEYYNALTDETIESLGLSQYLTTFRGQDPSKVRLIAFDVQEGHQQNLFPSTVIVQTGFHLSPEETVKERIEHDKYSFENTVILSEETRELTSEVVAYTYELTYTALTISTGDLVRIYTHVIVFEANGRVTSIQIQALDELRPIASAQFEIILVSLALFIP